MRNRGSGLAKAGAIFLALLVALVLTSMGYGIWSDTLTISGTVETGTQSTELTCSDNYTVPAGGSISCSVAGNVLTVTVTDAQLDVNYYCDFNIHNTGDIPVKIQSIVVSPLPPVEEVEVEIQEVAVGNQIEQDGITGDTVYGKVHVSLLPEPPDNPSKNTTFAFTVTFSVVQWNQYVP